VAWVLNTMSLKKTSRLLTPCEMRKAVNQTSEDVLPASNRAKQVCNVRHVTGCQVTQERRASNEEDDVASNFHDRSLPVERLHD